MCSSDLPFHARNCLEQAVFLQRLGEIQHPVTRRVEAGEELVDNDQDDFVLDMRHRFQNAMREDLIAAVEMNTERKVIAFMSENHIDPDMAAEVFVLEPQPDGDQPEQAED